MSLKESLAWAAGYAALAVLSAPIWIFLGKLWWEAINAALAWQPMMPT